MVPPTAVPAHDTGLAGVAYRRAMSGLRRWARSLVIVVVVAGLAIGVAVYLGKRDLTVPATSPAATGIRAHVNEIRTVPNVDERPRTAAMKEIARTLERIYTAAFGRPSDASTSPSPSPGPARRVRELFAPGAVAALKSSPGVFDLGPLVVTSGTADFEGVITFAGTTPSGAEIDVDFTGRAMPLEATEPAVRVHQRGTLTLRRSADGWLVRSFDLRLATRPEPTPSPRI